MFLIKSCAEQQIFFNNLSKKGASAQIPIEKHSHFRWQRAKETGNKIQFAKMVSKFAKLED